MTHVCRAWIQRQVFTVAAAVILALLAPAVAHARPAGHGALLQHASSVDPTLTVSVSVHDPPGFQTIVWVQGSGIICGPPDGVYVYVPCSVSVSALAHVVLKVGNNLRLTAYQIDWIGCTTVSADHGTCGLGKTFGFSNKNVTVSLTPITYTVTVKRAGNGNIQLPYVVNGHDCSASPCSFPDLLGNSAGVAAPTPAADSTFGGWDGCDGVIFTPPECEYDSLASDRTFTYTVTLKRYTLRVIRDGTGSGTVTSDPIGISCDPDCKEDYDAGTKVTLHPTAAAGSTFTGWGGACTGTGACIVTMDAAKSVSATFDLASQGGGGTGGGGGGGGGGGTGQPDTTLDAALAGVRVVRSKLGTRTVKVEITADEQVTVELTLERRGKTLAHKRVSTFDDPDGTIVLKLQKSIGKGKATLDITITDAAGNTETLTRSLKIPATKKPAKR